MDAVTKTLIITVLVSLLIGVFVLLFDQTTKGDIIDVLTESLEYNISHSIIKLYGANKISIRLIKKNYKIADEELKKIESLHNSILERIKKIDLLYEKLGVKKSSQRKRIISLYLRSIYFKEISKMRKVKGLKIDYKSDDAEKIINLYREIKDLMGQEINIIYNIMKTRGAYPKYAEKILKNENKIKKAADIQKLIPVDNYTAEKIFKKINNEYKIDDIVMDNYNYYSGVTDDYIEKIFKQRGVLSSRLNKIERARMLAEKGLEEQEEEKPAEMKIMININKADETQLTMLPGVSFQLAKKIVMFRKIKKGYKSITDLKGVPGMNDTVFNDISDKIKLSGESELGEENTGVSFSFEE